MNKILIVLALCLSNVFGVEFHSYEEALNLQNSNKKIIMMAVTRTNCHYCEDMQEKVLEDKEMAKWLDSRFLSVNMNLDIDELPLGLKVSFTPTFYFIDADKNVVKKIPGAWNIKDFKDLTKGIK